MRKVQFIAAACSVLGYQVRGEVKSTKNQDSGLLDPEHSKPRRIYYVYREKTH